MDYRKLGWAGVKVSPLCLGCMNFGGVTDEDDAVRIIHAAIDAGINFIDTANTYNDGMSEQIVGKALKGCRDKVVLATKVHGKRGPGPNDKGNSRYHIVNEVENSLRRLNTDHIDLYQLHRPDPDTSLEEQLSVLNDLVRQGKVRYLGTSVYPAWQMCESMWISDRRGFERFVSEQPPYNILGRDIERETMPFCETHNWALIPWSPLAGGWLTGKYRRGQAVPENSRGAQRGWDTNAPKVQPRLEAIEKLLALADEVGVPLRQFAVAWLLARPVVTSSIFGPRTMAQFEDYLKALDVELDDAVMKRVDEIVPPYTGLMGYY